MWLAREGDLADVLYAHWWITELERLDAIEAESRAIDQAYRMNWAFAAPKELSRERRTFRADLWRDPHDAGGLTAAEKHRVATLIASIIHAPTVVS
jgi:hypothetical protein